MSSVLWKLNLIFCFMTRHKTMWATAPANFTLDLFGSAIRISRKGWHMLLNFCFHTALTFAVFAGGINRIKYPIICQAVSAFTFHTSHSQSLAKNLWWMSGVGLDYITYECRYRNSAHHGSVMLQLPFSFFQLVRLYFMKVPLPFSVVTVCLITWS